MTVETESLNTPGQLIERLLDERDWTKKTLSLVIGTDETALNRVISAKRPLTAELALVLEEVFGTSADKFLQLQKKHELAQARLASTPDPDRKSRLELFGDLKISQLIKRGWISPENDKDVTALENAVTQFFGKPVDSMLQSFGHAAKKTDATSEVTITQIAWMISVRQLAQQISAPEYSIEKLTRALVTLKTKLEKPDQIEDVSGILNSAGVRLVVVESLPSAKIDGVCLWIDDSKPVIGLSARFDRIDNFWFVLRHEIEHILNGDGKTEPTGHLDAELEGKKAGTDSSLPLCEKRANMAAANFCITPESMDAFIAENNPYFSERLLVSFAATINVHPGLVAGQLQHRTGRHDRFRSHLVKIRAHLVNSAMTDGWGNIPSITQQGEL